MRGFLTFSVRVLAPRGRGSAGQTSTQEDERHAIHLGKRGCFVLTILCYLANICVQIRCALHKVTTQERPVGGGKRGGVSYILIRFMIRDSESTRLRTKGPGGLLTTNY